MTLSEELKYNAPVNKALPSLSTVGSLALAPKYLSSKLSKEFAALVALVAALLAEVDASFAFVVAVDADVAASAAFVVAVLADVDAELADVVALAASTGKSYFAEFALVVKGCEPDAVCAVLTIKILFVDVSLTISLTT